MILNIPNSIKKKIIRSPGCFRIRQDIIICVVNKLVTIHKVQYSINELSVLR